MAGAESEKTSMLAAWRTWYDDGVFAILMGALLAAFVAANWYASLPGWTKLAAIPAFVAWAWLQLHFWDAVEWMKEWLVFPRVGPHSRPPGSGDNRRSNYVTLGLSETVPVPAAPPRPYSMGRMIAAIAGGGAGTMAALGLVHARWNYLLAGAVIVGAIWLGAATIAIPWRLMLIFSGWSFAAWRYAPSPGSNSPILFWWCIGWCACISLAGMLSMATLLWRHPRLQTIEDGRGHGAG